MRALSGRMQARRTKLYYAPGACSLAPHIALREAGLHFELEWVDLSTKTTATGGDYRDINPKGQVSALLLDEGGLLTENAAVLQYIGDRGGDIIPPAGSMERYRAQEWLSFIGAELHKNFGPLVRGMKGEARQAFVDILNAKIGYIETVLAERDHLLASFSVADCYAFAVLRWTKDVNIPLDAMPNVAGYLKRIAERPTVREAMRAEGLKD